ncbi:predicted protein [Histoplasma capsulatum H143]|uniref:Uncharacterized protein n=1 Tax=Ajellomyces capsulatus (strain H143) TaxID=544712 RepID=C6HD54_AJECH|nr:predicted protein [Histoplasma capsulatum H143]
MSQTVASSFFYPVRGKGVESTRGQPEASTGVPGRFDDFRFPIRSQPLLRSTTLVSPMKHCPPEKTTALWWGTQNGQPEIRFQTEYTPEPSKQLLDAYFVISPALTAKIGLNDAQGLSTETQVMSSSVVWRKLDDFRQF